MKWIDLPPVWLALHVGAAWALAPYVRLATSAPWMATLGTVCISLGVALMMLALVSMRRAKTTVIPHREADQLVTSGIFAMSRNPIYLGDALILGGAALRAQAPLLLTLLLPFLLVIHRRFIQPEEARLRRRFGAAFEGYCSKTRRWL